MKKIYKIVDGDLVITVPMKTRRMNPYDDELGDEMDNIIGVYNDEWDNGLCYRIDMDYAGKQDQYSDFFFKLGGTMEDFKTMCEELNVDWVVDLKDK